MEAGNKKGHETMNQSQFEQTSEQIADTIHKASRAASSAAEAIEDGVGAARRAVKHGGYAAVEAFDDAKRRVQRNPIETVLATLAVGVAAGTAISWMMRRKRSCNCAEMQ
jgi:predicted negative regulator of RcsB-dependent stress response